MARSADNEATIRKLGGEIRRADLFDADALAHSAEGADVVVHAATAIPTRAKPRPEDWRTNDRIRRDGTRALARRHAGAGASRGASGSETVSGAKHHVGGAAGGPIGI
jgi:nucleoside-diphosphate-sugar epimerase